MNAPSLYAGMTIESNGECASALVAEPDFHMKCPNCGIQVPLRSGEDLNREWVREFSGKEYRAGAGISTAAVPD
jgi:hypothetical protein